MDIFLLTNFILYLIISFDLIKISISIETQQFYGDVPLNYFLRQFCQHSSMKTKLLLIANFQLNAEILKYQGSNSQISNYRKVLQSLSCKHLYFSQISTTSVIQELTQNTHLKFSKIQAIFDFTNFSVNTTEFKGILAELSAIYSQCHHCIPFIIVFSKNTLQLQQMSQELLPFLPVDFRCILVDSQTSLTVFLRPTFHSCAQQSTLFTPKSNEDFGKLKSAKCNLNMKKLTVAVNNDFPFCAFPAGKKIQLEYSVEFELLKAMEGAYNFTSQFIDAKNTWGMKQANGRWSGLIGLVANRTSDFGMCEISRNAERLKIIDYTRFIFIDQVIFISQSPTTKPTSFLFLLNRISYKIWFCQLVLSNILIIHLAICQLVKLKSTINWNQLVKAIDEAMLNIWGIYFRQPIPSFITETFTATRLLYATWAIGSFILATAYSSIFYSGLTVPEYEPAIDTVADLTRAARTDSHLIQSLDQSSTLATILNADPVDSTNYAIQQHMHRVKVAMFTLQTQILPLIESNRRNIIITLSISARARRFVYARKPLHIGSEPMEPIYLAWALPKRSPLTEPFNRKIVALREMGLFHKWLQTTIRLRKAKVTARQKGPTVNDPVEIRKSGQRKQSADRLTFSELSSVFSFYFAFLGICCFAFVWEVTVKWVCSRKKSQFK